jgi:hypothetical protein
VGYEGRLLSNPSSYLPLLGALQLVLLLFLDGYYSPIRLIPYFETILLISVALGIASVAVIWILPRSPVGTYEISYLDDRTAGGELHMSYTNMRGERREGLVVVKFKASKTIPLYRKASGAPIDSQVKGTRTSLRIVFRGPKVGLALGFPGEAEMNEVLYVLNGKEI